MRGHRLWTWLGLVVGLAFGLSLALIPAADAARNATGTMSLVSGNPVVSGTVISSSMFNNTMSDIKTEITDSLSRSGKGAMLAPLELANGTVSLPAVTFDSDPDTGLYRPDAGDIGVAIDGVLVCQMHGAGVLVNGQLTAFVAPSVDGYGVYATGGVNRNGVRGISSDSVSGVYGTSTSGGAGVEGLGGTSGSGGTFTGGPSGGVGVAGLGAVSAAGGSFLGGSSGGPGVRAEGGAGGVGVTAFAASASTGGTRTSDYVCNRGDIDMTAVADPTSTTSISDRITPVSFAKVWGNITYGSATPTVNAGLNITSTSCSSNRVTVTVGGDFASTNYAVIATTDTADTVAHVVSTAAGSFVIGAFTAGVVVNMCSTSGTLHVMAIGAQ